MEQKPPVVQEKKKGFECSVEFCITLMRWFDIGVAIFVIGYGFYQYVEVGVDTKSFSSVFQPFYLILFGILLICAEGEFVMIVKWFKFLDNLFGRGFYNIFLATMVVNSLPISLDNSKSLHEIVQLILTAILALIGLIYIFIYICRCGGKSKKYQEIDEEEGKNQISQSLIQSQAPAPPNTLTFDQWQQLQSNPKEYSKWLQAQLQKTQLEQQQLQAEGPKIK